MPATEVDRRRDAIPVPIMPIPMNPIGLVVDMVGCFGLFRIFDIWVEFLFYIDGDLLAVVMRLVES